MGTRRAIVSVRKPYLGWGDADRMHPTDVDSRTGSLFCQFCEDFVWDPTLEDLRIRKMGTGSFSSSMLAVRLAVVTSQNSLLD
jgi:hypothetical protein